MVARRQVSMVAALALWATAASLAFQPAQARVELDGAVAGTAAASGSAPQPIVDQAVTPFFTVDLHGGYLATGTAMRNQGFGHLRLGQLPDNSTVQAAFLVWDILGTQDTPQTTHGHFAEHPIVGTLAATGASPCWSNADRNASYVADVTPYVTGNGRYRLRHFPSGRRDAQDPWSGSKLPMIEGATLMVVYENPRSPLTHIELAAGATMASLGTMRATFDGFIVAADPAIKTTFVVADGQDSLDGPTTFNGQRLQPHRWHGEDHQNAPTYSYGNLWDTRTYDVSDATSAGQTSIEATIDVNEDCLVWVGQALSVNL